MNKLTNDFLSVSVPGKLILIGEHSVVYGHTAIAMPLKDIQLTLSTGTESHETWHDVWQISMLGEPLKLSEHFRNLLTDSFSLAVSLFGFDLKNFAPQSLIIDSQIPLGGGMGGSAAVAASFICLCEKLFQKSYSLKTKIEYANQIDSLFHSGRASGLDVATILTGQLIQYSKSESFQTIQSNCSFYIALIDTKERSETSKMIQIVSNLITTESHDALNAMKTLSRLAKECIKQLELGDINSFADNLNHAQICLNTLQVSTPTIELFCTELKSLGALAAKLTGAGGGGLVLSLFKEYPSFLKEKYPSHNTFITKISS